MINRYLVDIIKSHLPYLPNGEQEQLLETLATFLVRRTPDSLFLLKGYAGTGKTSLIGALVKSLTDLRLKTVLLAPTGRAAKVFAGYAEHPAFTIHKKIYRQKSFSAEYEGFAIADNLHKDTIFIVDEASMISNSGNDSAIRGVGRLLDDLIEYVYGGERCLLILLGDQAQLPPVGENISPALDENRLSAYGLHITVFELQQVARQTEDSGILFNATRLRKQMTLSPLPEPQIRIDGFTDLSVLPGDELIEALSGAYSRNGIDNSIVITRSNKRANIFNRGIRNQVLFREEELSSGDMLLIAKNNYYWSSEYKEIDFIANGDTARIVKVLRQQELYGFRFADVILYFTDYQLEMEAKVVLDSLTTEAPALTPEMNLRLFNAVMEDYSQIPTKTERMRKIKTDPYFNALQIKYGYSITCHKAQGGQWDNVFLDIGYLHPDYLSIDFYRWLYTSVTRSTQRLYLINLDERFREPAGKTSK